MDNLNKVEIGSPIWIDQQRAVCNAATVAPWSWNGDVLTSHWTNVISVFDNECGASFTLEIDESDRAFIAISRTALPAALDEIERLAADNRKLREAHELAQSGYGTYTHTGNENVMQREAEKDAKIEEQGKRIKFLEDHILRTTRAYKKSRDKLLDERDRLTAERDAEKKRADAAEPGPWKAKQHNDYQGAGYGTSTYYVSFGDELIKIGASDDNTECSKLYAVSRFIAAARTDIPDLLSALRAAYQREDAIAAELAAAKREKDVEKKRADDAECKIYEIAHDGLCAVCEQSRDVCEGSHDTSIGCPFVNLFVCGGVCGAVDPDEPCAENAPSGAESNTKNGVD